MSEQRKKRIFRTPKARDSGAKFTRVDQKLTNDERLSYLAIGVGLHILSKPDDWVFSADRIANARKQEGVHRIEGAIKELETFGYIVRRKTRKPNGQFETELFFREVPTAEFCLSAPTANLPTAGEPTGRSTEGRQSGGPNNDCPTNDVVLTTDEGTTEGLRVAEMAPQEELRALAQYSDHLRRAWLSYVDQCEPTAKERGIRSHLLRRKLLGGTSELEAIEALLYPDNADVDGMVFVGWATDNPINYRVDRSVEDLKEHIRRGSSSKLWP